MLNFSVVSKNVASAQVGKMIAMLQPIPRKELSKQIAVSIAFKLRRKFVANGSKRNRLNAPSTGFWKKAAESTTAEGDSDSATIRVAHKGVALQYYGGTVVPDKAKALAIPLRAEFHGRSPSETRRRR